MCRKRFARRIRPRHKPIAPPMTPEEREKIDSLREQYARLASNQRRQSLEINRLQRQLGFVPPAVALVFDN